MITTSSGGASTVTVQYVDTAGAGTAGSAQAPLRMLSMRGTGITAAALGKLGGADRASLVLWRTNAVGSFVNNSVQILQEQPDFTFAEIPQTVVLGAGAVPDNGTVLVGDVDPSVSGDEIVLAGGGRSSDRVHLRVLGMPEHHLQLLVDAHPLGRVGGRQLCTFALGKVVPDTVQRGLQIVAGCQSGRIYVLGVAGGQARLYARRRAFPDRPGASARNIAVGDFLPHHPGDEIAVADDGTAGDGLVRIFDGDSGELLMEFVAFDPAAAPAGVELWAGDLLPGAGGDELIAGQGSAGGMLRVFSLASGVPRRALDVPGAASRATCLDHHLAVGNLAPWLSGNQLAVAQSDATSPLQIFGFDARRGRLVATMYAPSDSGTVTGIAAGH